MSTTNNKNSNCTKEQLSESAEYLKAISSAWGIFWNKYKEKIIYGSWLDGDDIEPSDMNWIKENCERSHVPDALWRPKVLSGLESNNGWTRINDDGSNLPSDRTEQFQNEYILGFMDDQGNFQQGNKTVLSYRIEELFRKKKITHYRVVDYHSPVY